MFRSKVVVVSQIFLFISLFLSWICVSYFLVNKSLSSSVVTILFFSSILCILSFYYVLSFFSKLGRSKIKQIGVISGNIFIYLLIIFIFYSNYYQFINGYIMGNKNISDLVFLSISVSSLMLIFQIVSTTILLSLDITFLICYFKTLLSYSKEKVTDVLKKETKIRKNNKEIYNIYRFFYVSTFSFTMSIIFLSDIFRFYETNNKELFKDRVAIFYIVLTAILIFIPYVILFLSRKRNNYLSYKISKRISYRNLSAILLSTSTTLVLLFSILYIKFDISAFAFISLLSSNIYIIPNLIMLEKTNCNYIDSYIDIDEESLQQVRNS